MTAGREIAPEVLEAAAGWLVRLHDGPVDDRVRVELAAWCDAHPDHARAWRHAEVLMADFSSLPPDLGQATLARRRVSRRQLTRQLALLLAAGPALWLGARSVPWQALTADYRTATGEQRDIRLADGSLVALNTASAIRVVTSPEPVRLELVAGELLVTVPRKIVPLQLTSAHGQVALSDARVLVRRYDHGERVSVLDGQAHLSVNGVRDGLVLQAGWEAWLRRSEPMRPAAADTGRDAWTRGMLIADRMRLADVLAEMGRYRRGVLRCHPSVADLPVSGALPVRDSDRGLALLAASFPVSVRRVTDYWVSVEPVA